MQTRVKWEQVPRWKRTVGLSLGALMMIANLWWAHLYFDYRARMPRAPEQ